MKQAKESADPKAQLNGAESQSSTSKEGGEKAAKESGAERDDAISMLKQDHREVEGLFDRYESATRRADRAKIVRQVCNALTLHAILEEEYSIRPAENSSTMVLSTRLRSSTTAQKFSSTSSSPGHRKILSTTRSLRCSPNKSSSTFGRNKGRPTASSRRRRPQEPI